MIAEEIRNKIIKEVKMLKNTDDCVGIKIGDDKGLFIQVENINNEKVYFIELNEVDEDNVYEPCGEYNTFSKFGDMKELIEAIEQYISINYLTY